MKRQKTKKREQDDDVKPSNDHSRWKYLAFVGLFTFPGIMYVVDFLTTIPSNSRLSYVYVVGTGVLTVATWFFLRNSLKLSYKFIIVIILPFLLFPSFKVYLCSPVLLVNREFGTRFKLGTTAEEIARDCGESCVKHISKSLYSLSLVSPRITLEVLSSEIINLNATTNSAFGGDQAKMSKLFLLFSLRSVKGRVHSISMITKVPFRSTKILFAMENNKRMDLTGRIVNIGKDMKEVKAGLERQKLFVRPIVFQPYQLESNDYES